MTMDTAQVKQRAAAALEAAIPQGEYSTAEFGNVGSAQAIEVFFDALSGQSLAIVWQGDLKAIPDDCVVVRRSEVLDGNRRRELTKVLDVLKKANEHFHHEAMMNAALHMADTVRPAPLAAAVEGSVDTLIQLLED